RIERHVHPTSLEYGPKRNDHLDRTLHHDPDAALGLYAEVAQVARELVCTRVQLRVSKVLLRKGESRRLGSAAHLLLEKRGQSFVESIVARSVVPLDEDLLPFGFRQQREFRQPPLRMTHDPFQQI